ncbi:MAG: methylmalonyl Co-A mutase-associated GTPase MeaB [Myxococcales bacterium]|nr:methylmalonyl Co-A mutase-associated GTPase MeaB [Myxococcales bacterium]MDH5566602.1 methylmalonyl Co-A mutase-associated GTPase MeaB [Myxococcales bacterium]
MSAGELDVQALCAAVRAGDRRALARSITLLESTRADHVAQGQQLIEALLPLSGRADRLGVSGAPGVGKSLFIETLGLRLLDAGRRVAVLAVDPSSPRSGGSILGDKTRMEQLARRPEAFIRPSPSSGRLGGVAQRTREAMLVCEVAGYDVVIVETVGVGQSELAVAGMVDFFLVLLQPGAGDALQGIKRGVLELADGLVVNKADGEWRESAERARADYEQALHMLRPLSPSWTPRVLSASARTGTGIPEVWEMVLAQRSALQATGEAQKRRREQSRAWLWNLVEEGLQREFRAAPEVARQVELVEKQVEALEVTPARAARILLEAFRAA